MSQRPNILFITSHDIGQHLGCYGVGTVQTESMDRLAAEGVHFARSFCVAPQCSPSRAAMHTGRYPHSNGVLGLTHGGFAWDLHSQERHLAMILRGAGYHTGVIGVQHESLKAERCGFDELDTSQDPAASIAEKCEQFFIRHKQSRKPFYLQVGFFEPHRKFDFGGAHPDETRGISLPPYLRDEPSARSELAAFQGAIRHLDLGIGSVLAALETHGMREDTLVIFAADHGIPFPRAKCSLYDPGIEVALLMRWPARGWRGGRVMPDLISNVDYFPTILDAAGLRHETNVQGLSFAALLDGRRYSGRKEVFAEMTYHQYYDPMRCIRTERFKLICNFSTSPSFMNPSQTYRPATTTLMPAVPEYSQHPDLELFDLHADPREFSNLANNPDYDAERIELTGRLCAWMNDTQDPLLKGVPVSPQHQRLLALFANARGETEAQAAHTINGVLSP